jgi:hypothetical protein
VGRVRGGRRKRRRGRGRVRVGAPDPRLTGVSGMVAVAELCDRLGVVEALDAAVGPVKQRDRGFGAGGVAGGSGCGVVGWGGLPGGSGSPACRCGRAGDRAGCGLVSTTAAGLARRVTGPQWIAVETGLAWVSERVLDRVGAARRAWLCTEATIDLDATDVEVYGRKKTWGGL